MVWRRSGLLSFSRRYCLQVPPSSTNFGPYSFGLHCWPKQSNTRSISLATPRQQVGMASSDHGLEQKWPAAKVRATYLDFFKQQSHQFGTFCANNEASPIELTDASALFLSRASRRPDVTLHKCWNEPVQIHLLGHGRSPIRLCHTQARCKLAKGKLGIIQLSN